MQMQNDDLVRALTLTLTLTLLYPKHTLDSNPNLTFRRLRNQTIGVDSGISLTLTVTLILTLTGESHCLPG